MSNLPGVNQGKCSDRDRDGHRNHDGLTPSREPLGLGFNPANRILFVSDSRSPSPGVLIVRADEILQTVPDHERGRLEPRVHPQLPKDVLNVCASCLRAHNQGAPDRLIICAIGQEAENLLLAPRQR